MPPLKNLENLNSYKDKHQKRIKVKSYRVIITKIVFCYYLYSESTPEGHAQKSDQKFNTSFSKQAKRH